jgi:uncharacterized protein involved in type VI secretion and phage assembly
MSLIDLFQNVQEARARGIMGVAVAVVTNNEDPSNEGRVKVNFPWRGEDDESSWVRIATFMAGPEMGGYFLPEVGDEVLVAFEKGDIDHPYILGFLWSGKMKPPETNSDGKNNRRLIKSRSGHLVILDDSDGDEKIEIIDKSGNNKIVVETAANKITIESAQDIEIKAQNKISLQATELEFKADAMAKLEAGANMELKATGNATLKGAMVMIN